MTEPSSPSIEAQLAVINTKLDLVLATRDDHEVRLRNLEKFRWLIVGAAFAGGGLWQAIAPHVS